MSETITWTQDVRLGSGLRLASSRVVTVDAYDVIEVNIGASATDIEVEVQPSAATQIQFLMITPGRTLDRLRYKVNSAASTTEINLDAPQTFVSTEAIELLGADPISLFFSSDAGNDATVQILVGRKATP